MKKTVLFHVSGNQYDPFPATHHTRRIWEELSRGVDEYHLVARGRINSYQHSVHGKIHLHLLPAWGRRMWVFFLLSWALPFFVLRYRPTHLVAQCPVLGGLAASACSKLFGIPLFMELHGVHYFVPTTERIASRLEHLCYRLLSPISFAAAQKIRSLSEHMTQELRRVYGAGAVEKAVVVPNRVDLKVFSRAKDCYSIEGAVRIVMVGSFYPVKNQLALVEALHRCGIDFRLSLVGAGPLKGAIVELAQKLGIADRLEIHQNLSHAQLADLLVRHDLYVHYSLAEGVPRAVLEAMAAGLPVVSTPVGYINGVLVHGENALLLQEPWGDDLCATLGRLLESQPLRESLGRRARRTIEEKFEWHRVFALYRREILSCAPPVSGPKVLPPCVS
ncbi:glycosyltransferase family 4 protein [Geomonas sp. RF6]|uniref:glycosyltransferase family 4 protein n=1 Tax=Geomonas sp. RF6 TaxID=2897342 RepID=UPI001E35BF33|nr:glycosyltransferase family 4 protein [Geomonas sp. RF6]UFS69930.1 glycosyltransferase family 4 protein [Geomonas sp. RF6]